VTLRLRDQLTATCREKKGERLLQPPTGCCGHYSLSNQQRVPLDLPAGSPAVSGTMNHNRGLIIVPVNISLLQVSGDG